MKLTENNFPHAAMESLLFKTIDGEAHFGRYAFNNTGARRWIDDDTGEEFTSDMVTDWYFYAKELDIRRDFGCFQMKM